MSEKPLYDGWTLKLPNTQGEMQDVGDLDTTANLKRLIELGAFLYEDEEGRVSVRLERKRRGSEVGYWVLYKRQCGRLHKTYVCEAYMLDAHNLDWAYRRLMSNVAFSSNRA